MSASAQVRRLLETIRKMPRPLGDGDAAQASVMDLRPGGYFRAGGIVYRVEEISSYVEKDGGNTWKWYEMKVQSLADESTSYLEWEVDDELEVYLYGDKITISELGLTKAQLEEFDDEEEGSFKYKGTKYHYDDSGDVTFYKGVAPDEEPSGGEPYYYWDFYDKSEKNCIGVERWGSSFEASHGIEQNPKEIRVLVKGGK